MPLRACIPSNGGNWIFPFPDAHDEQACLRSMGERRRRKKQVQSWLNTNITSDYYPLRIENQTGYFTITPGDVPVRNMAPTAFEVDGVSQTWRGQHGRKSCRPIKGIPASIHLNAGETALSPAFIYSSPSGSLNTRSPQRPIDGSAINRSARKSGPGPLRKGPHPKR